MNTWCELLTAHSVLFFWAISQGARQALLSCLCMTVLMIVVLPVRILTSLVFVCSSYAVIYGVQWLLFVLYQQCGAPQSGEWLQTLSHNHGAVTYGWAAFAAVIQVLWTCCMQRLTTLPIKRTIAIIILAQLLAAAFTYLGLPYYYV